MPKQDNPTRRAGHLTLVEGGASSGGRTRSGALLGAAVFGEIRRAVERSLDGAAEGMSTDTPGSGSRLRRGINKLQERPKTRAVIQPGSERRSDPALRSFSNIELDDGSRIGCVGLIVHGNASGNVGAYVLMKDEREDGNRMVLVRLPWGMNQDQQKDSPPHVVAKGVDGRTQSISITHDKDPHAPKVKIYGDSYSVSVPDYIENDREVVTLITPEDVMRDASGNTARYPGFNLELLRLSDPAFMAGFMPPELYND